MFFLEIALTIHRISSDSKVRFIILYFSVCRTVISVWKGLQNFFVLKELEFKIYVNLLRERLLKSELWLGFVMGMAGREPRGLIPGTLTVVRASTISFPCTSSM